MFNNIVLSTLCKLAVSLPLESSHEDSAILVRDADILALRPRNPIGVSYTNQQNFLVNSAGPSFAGPFDPNNAGFCYHGEGNFVVYTGDPAAGKPVYSSNTGGNAVCSNASQCYMTFTRDGNLLVLVAGSIVWQTHTTGNGYLVAFNGQAPYVVVYNKRGSAIWKSSAGTANPPPPPTCYKGVCP